MADEKEKGNVTPAKPKRIFKKDIAADMHMSPRHMRELERWNANLQVIQTNLKDRPDLWKYLEKRLRDSDNKKHGLSREETQQLAMLPKDRLTDMVEGMKESPRGAKATLQQSLPDHTIKTTVTLPSHINQWYIEQAASKGISKTQYIILVLNEYASGSFMENENDAPEQFTNNEKSQKETEFESILRIIGKTSAKGAMRTACQPLNKRVARKEYNKKKEEFISKHGEQWRAKFEAYE